MTQLTTGYVRVTVSAGARRVDVSLPDDLPIVELLPELLRSADVVDPDRAHLGYLLSRFGGDVLDPTRPLAAHDVLDGEILYLKPAAETAPGLVYDDVIESVAEAAQARWPLWTDRAGRTAAAVIGALLLVGGAALLGLSLRMQHAPALTAAAVLTALLLGLAAISSHLCSEPVLGAASGVAALAYAMVTGWGAVPVETGHEYGRLQLLAAAVGFLVASMLAGAAVGRRFRPLFVTTGVVGLVGSAAIFGLTMTGTTPVRAAAGAVATLALVHGFLPALAVRVARLPLPAFTVDDDAAAASHDEVAERARWAHELLVAVAAGAGAVVVAASGILSFAGGGWAQTLALLGGASLLLRARSFRLRGQVLPPVVAGAAAIALSLAGVASHTPHPLNWPFVVVAGAGGALIMGGLVRCCPEAALYTGRVLDAIEALLLVSMVPVALAVLGLYDAVRQTVS